MSAGMYIEGHRVEDGPHRGWHDSRYHHPRKHLAVPAIWDPDDMLVSAVMSQARINAT
jgi:hypothetical protein